MTTTHFRTADSPTTRLLAAAGAALTIPAFMLCTISGETGGEIVASIEDKIVPLEVGAILAAVGAALLFAAAARLGAAMGGLAGTVATASGAAVAAIFAAYYGVFGASAATVRLAEAPSDAIGDATQLLLNLVDYARYAPGLALVLSAVAAKDALPKGVWITAIVLGVLTVVPMTTWAAAVLIPVWLGISAATTRIG